MRVFEFRNSSSSGVSLVNAPIASLAE